MFCCTAGSATRAAPPARLAWSATPDVQTGNNSHAHRVVRYRLPDGAIINIRRDVRHAETNGLIDREMLRSQNFTGILT